MESALRIGRFVVLNLDLTVGHESRIDDYVTISPGVHISGRVHVGEGCDLGTGANVVPGVRADLAAAVDDDQ